MTLNTQNKRLFNIYLLENLYKIFINSLYSKKIGWEL